MDGFWNEMARLGKDRNPYRAGFLQFVGVGESRQHAMDLYGEAAEYFYGHCLHIDPRFAAPPGYATEATQRIGLQSQVAKAASYSDKFNMLAREMDAIVDNGYVIIGSPDEVVEQLREVAVNLNVGNLMLLLQFGNMSKELTKYNTRLFAEQVMPKLQPLFAEWEHRWWPQPMASAQRARGARLHTTPGRRVDGRPRHPLLHRRRRAGGHDARLPAGARRHRRGGAGKARRLPARFPRRHRASIDHAGDARTRPAGCVPRPAAQRGPHARRQIGEELIQIADFSHLPTQAKFIAFMPQWDFLDFLADQAKRFPTFRLLMQHRGDRPDPRRRRAWSA